MPLRYDCSTASGRADGLREAAAAAPAVDAFMDSGQDDADFVDLDDVLGGRP
ncbi:hypothetical protein ACFYYS_17760 [Streptomyces sp. NPDC002120]|uniref:hypothetical protein n=1 Tax=Streptomyces sp. NPDC002120 TaxID=3364631 RepID=UPI0036A992CD